MRDPITISQEKQREEGDPENVMDNHAGAQEDLDTVNKLDMERNRIESVKQQRGVHSPTDKFTWQNHGVGNDSSGRTKQTLRNSLKGQSKTKAQVVNSGGS